MTGNGAMVTPIRGASGAQGNPSRPILEPKTITVNPLLVMGFGAAMVIAIGMALFAQFGTPDDAGTTMVDPVPGGRVTSTNTRMATGLNLGEGRMTATLETDALPPPSVTVTGPNTIALQARVAELEIALDEASKEVPEVGALIEQLASAKGRVAELEVSLRDAARERDRSEIEFERRLRDERSDIASAHKTEIEQLGTEHEKALAVVEGRLTELMDERAAASRAARIRSRSVLVNKGAPKAGTDFGAPVVPNDPATSLGRGATFRANLVDDVDTIGPGSITAMVVADVRSASGEVVLIPEGSTLRGRYRSDTSAGDGRVVISWNELTLQPEGKSKRLSSGPRGENAFVTTLWPSDPASMKRDAGITVLVANEIALAD